MSRPFAGLDPQDRPSKFRKHNIPIMRTDIMLWDQAWEKALRTLSPSEEMYPTFSRVWDRDFQTRRMDVETVSNELYKRGCTLQEYVLLLDGDMDTGDDVVTAWMLLDDRERRRHLLKGMKAACENTLLYLDARALCPEITTTAMLKQRGKAFLDFARKLANGIRESGPDTLYLFPSEWFRSAVKEPEPWSDKTKFIFKQLGIHRAEFIATFVVQSLMSVYEDLISDSPGMKTATDLLKTDSHMASMVADALPTMFLDKPLIRCQNCTKTPEEVGESANFMICSKCKAKLNFPLHYCSTACQKADWPTHKKHCGKEKVAKRLPRTIHDPYWQFPCADSLRAVDPPAGGILWPIESDFRAPHPDHPHNPALQRQVALLKQHLGVEYFLFDDLDCPVPFVINDLQVKISFRSLRKQVMFGPAGGTTGGVELMAEHMIARAVHSQEFSRDRILAQLGSEYDRDVAGQLAILEASEAGSSHHPEAAFIERMSVMSEGFERIIPVPVLIPSPEA